MRKIWAGLLALFVVVSLRPAWSGSGGKASRNPDRTIEITIKNPDVQGGSIVLGHQGTSGSQHEGKNSASIDYLWFSGIMSQDVLNKLGDRLTRNEVLANFTSQFETSHQQIRDTFTGITHNSDHTWTGQSTGQWTGVYTMGDPIDWNRNTAKSDIQKALKAYGDSMTLSSNDEVINSTALANVWLSKTIRAFSYASQSQSESTSSGRSDVTLAQAQSQAYNESCCSEWENSPWMIKNNLNPARVWRVRTAMNSQQVSVEVKSSNTSSKVTHVRLLSGHEIGEQEETVVRTTKADANYALYEVGGEQLLSPLVLDMDGDGKIEASGGNYLPHPSNFAKTGLVRFDLLGNGFPVFTEWVGPRDGLLCRPHADGSVDGKSLFGTVEGFSTGFEKLATLDANGDGRVSGDELSGLFVWLDLNGNADVDPGELHSLRELGITEISTRHDSRMRGDFVRNGKRYLVWDWWPNYLEGKKIR